jgi:uncharacterized protein YdeI (YjbR/CyaY-like superfamily)
MPKKEPRIDAYIAKAAPFAQPILRHLRKLAHAADPAMEETLKWGMPHFLHEGIVFGMAAFKAHCTLGFWKGSMILDADNQPAKVAMGQFGKITALADLPGNKALASYIKQAVKLNVEGIQKAPRPRPKERKALVVPDYFKAALRKNKQAQASFDGFSYSHKKEYVEWITEAKQEDTRQRRLGTAIEWMAKGKSRNWKYEKC